MSNFSTIQYLKKKRRQINNTENTFRKETLFGSAMLPQIILIPTESDYSLCKKVQDLYMVHCAS